MERCPNCRARTDGGPACRRCGMDLALLQAVERAADRRLRQAITALAEGDEDAARQAALHAASLHRTAFTQRLAGLIGARRG